MIGGGVIDTTGEIKGEYDNDCFSTYTVVDLLNSLAEENKELKEFKEQVRDEIQDRYDLSNHKPVFMFMAKRLGLELFE